MDRVHATSIRTQLRESALCPICLELLKSPRALVCLHTFCENCIQGVVNGLASSSTSIKGIPCPVCREESTPPGTNLPPSVWAKHLRKNITILPLIESLTNNRQPTRSVQDGHSGPRSSTITETGACTKHPTLPLLYYCRDHSEGLCKRCKTTHRQCTDVAVLTAKEMKTDIDWSKQDINTAFERSLSEITTIIEALQANARNTVTAIGHFPTRVRELQTIMNRNIDKLCEKLESNSERAQIEHTKLQESQIADCRKLENTILLYKTELAFVLQHQGLFQQFLACESVKSQISDFQNAIATAKSSTQLCQVRLVAVQLLESIIRVQDELSNIDCKTFKPDFLD